MPSFLKQKKIFIKRRLIDSRPTSPIQDQGTFTTFRMIKEITFYLRFCICYLLQTVQNRMKVSFLKHNRLQYS